MAPVCPFSKVLEEHDIEKHGARSDLWRELLQDVSCNDMSSRSMVLISHTKLHCRRLKISSPCLYSGLRAVTSSHGWMQIANAAPRSCFCWWYPEEAYVASKIYHSTTSPHLCDPDWDLKQFFSDVFWGFMTFPRILGEEQNHTFTHPCIFFKLEFDFLGFRTKLQETCVNTVQLKHGFQFAPQQQLPPHDSECQNHWLQHFSEKLKGRRTLFSDNF